MNEMIFEGTDALYNHLASKGGANPATHGTLGNFYSAMSNYRNPNTCGCKKGQKAVNAIRSVYSNLHNSLSGQQLLTIKPMFDNNIVVLKLDGAEVGRF